MEHNFGNAVACMPQLWDWLEDKRDKDNEMSKRVWKAVEARVREVRVIETKRRREKEIKKIAEEWEIWDKEKEVVKLEEEAKRLVPERFYK